MASSDASRSVPIAQYQATTQLTLFPHSPPDPYGHNIYKFPEGLREKSILSEREAGMSKTARCFDDENQPYLLNTDQHDNPDNSLRIEVVRVLSGGHGRGNQVVLVKILHMPSCDPKFPLPDKEELAVAKIFDPLFYSTSFPEDLPFWKDTSRADMRLSREAGAYKELHEKDLTGYPHLAPQYYGCWTTCLTSYSPDCEGKTRHVGLVLLEYIEGSSIQAICRHDDDDVLVPPTQRTYLVPNGPDSIHFDLEKRLDILAQLIEGTIKQIYKGVWHDYVEPENVLISMRNKSTLLETQRVCLISYDICMIDSKLRDPVDRWSRFPHPPHPTKCFDLDRFHSFGGWWPLDWENGKGDEHFENWLLERFGEHDSDRYSCNLLYSREWLKREREIAIKKARIKKKREMEKEKKRARRSKAKERRAAKEAAAEKTAAERDTITGLSSSAAALRITYTETAGIAFIQSLMAAWKEGLKADKVGQGHEGEDSRGDSVAQPSSLTETQSPSVSLEADAEAAEAEEASQEHKGDGS
ncbi:hypothetical protein CABS01_10545 [Colletotrichum abscissum]|uniref:Protein kinase domain-containing protein n=1 Tax=Colletotrichum abscissum TaxID=1671311 RepID=A0A9Q0B3L2_9PEZI|nr:uncharacterized protein CABS01_10545 [Colletotrichum abscissum]KAI3550096.1 hypothetical protein CABS02_07784 [Colletotrichum abscissum]KAK1498770.1 hypothetical protein CABS01_10545 [Colletotrichum abscissum]